MFTHQIEYSSPDGDTLYCEVDFNVKFGHPGKLSGLPEDCFPPEPNEITIIAIRPHQSPIVEQLVNLLEKTTDGSQLLKNFWQPIIDWIHEHCEEELNSVAEKQGGEQSWNREDE
jgi:hypothetical protein